MKRMILILAIALAASSCGGDAPGPPLTASEYSDQGNVICVQMNADLDRLSAQASANTSPEVQRDIFVEANNISRDAVDGLFELSPPASLVDERLVLLDLVEDRRVLIERSNNGEDTFDQINQVNQDFEERAGAIWPSCTRP